MRATDRCASDVKSFHDASECVSFAHKCLVLRVSQSVSQSVSHSLSWPVLANIGSTMATLYSLVFRLRSSIQDTTAALRTVPFTA